MLITTTPKHHSLTHVHNICSGVPIHLLKGVYYARVSFVVVPRVYAGKILELYKYAYYTLAISFTVRISCKYAEHFLIALGKWTK